ncbi:MAG: DUF4376 domain-containing protein [Phascolarctobacterium succinatutens]|uniref:DUF4376 domain-containing protein n=1 Tax=Phascolarctobacterium succinatutens TaxID=626940 RepID=UPI0039951AAE
MYYIFNEKGEIVSTSTAVPDLIDLATRTEVAVESAIDYDLNEIYLKDGSITLKPIDIETVKQRKILMLKQRRDKAEVAPVAYNGNTYDYDSKARERIAAAIVALDLQGEDANIAWTTADNQDAIVTAADLRAIVAAVAVRSNLLHIAYRKAKAQVEAAGTAEEADDVTLEL